MIQCTGYLPMNAENMYIKDPLVKVDINVIEDNNISCVIRFGSIRNNNFIHQHSIGHTISGEELENINEMLGSSIEPVMTTFRNNIEVVVLAHLEATYELCDFVIV